MRYAIIAWSLLLVTGAPAHAEVSIAIGLPSVQIGINVPVYPELVAVPGYPVYYDPRGDSNYFFYDGLYWAYQGDNWYSSDWYDGPWRMVDPYYVPLFVLRVPVQYYRRPPAYFRAWIGDAPPRWGEHWGPGWEQRRGGWDHWDRGSVPVAAPLPAYQRQYSGDRYPRAQDQQRSIRQQNYAYKPRDTASRQQPQQAAGASGARSPSEKRDSEQPRSPSPQQQQPATRSDRPSQASQAPRSTNQPDASSRSQPAPQQNDRRNAQPSQDNGRDSRPAPAERSRPSAPPAQDRSAPPQPQERARQAPAPQQEERGREAKAPPQEQGRDNKKEDRGPEGR